VTEEKAQIFAWSAADIQALLPAVSLMSLFLLGWILWLLPQFNLPLPVVVAFAVFFLVIAARPFRAMWQKRNLILLGLRRLAGGIATIQVTPAGVDFIRRYWTEHYQWNDVKAVRLEVDKEPGQPDEQHVVIVFKSGADAWIEDDTSWSKFEVLNTWSNGVLITKRV
jgi:hypothetical protein